MTVFRDFVAQEEYMAILFRGPFKSEACSGLV